MPGVKKHPKLCTGSVEVSVSPHASSTSDDGETGNSGLFRADELPPVPDWARRAPGDEDAGLFGHDATED